MRCWWGSRPTRGGSAQAILGKIIQGKPVSAAEERPTVPANVDAAVRKALEKLPANRFKSAAGFAAGLNDPHFTTTPISGLASAPATAGSPARAMMGWPVAAILALIVGWLGAAVRSDKPCPCSHTFHTGLRRRWPQVGRSPGFSRWVVVRPDHVCRDPHPAGGGGIVSPPAKHRAGHDDFHAGNEACGSRDRDRAPGGCGDGSAADLSTLWRQCFRPSDVSGRVGGLPHRGSTCRSHPSPEGRAYSAGSGASEQLVLACSSRANDPSELTVFRPR